MSLDIDNEDDPFDLGILSTPMSVLKGTSSSLWTPEIGEELMFFVFPGDCCGIWNFLLFQVITTTHLCQLIWHILSPCLEGLLFLLAEMRIYVLNFLRKCGIW
jgi:hypothetical protein